MEKRFKAMERFEVGEPRFLKNLVLFPLTDGDTDLGRISLLSEALAKNHLEIKELKAPRMDTIVVKNNSDLPVLALEGEGLIGAWQDRVINSSALIAKKSEVKIPVSCVESGRWSGDKEFFSGWTISYPSLRAIISQSVSQSLSLNRRFQADQNRVWRSITEKIKRFKVNSVTSSMHDVYSQARKQLLSYKEGVEEIKGWNGVIVLIGKEILCIDLFGSKRLFTKLKEALIASYALDALESRIPTTPRIERVKEIWEEVKRTPGKRFPSFALGDELRLETRDLFGRCLIYNEKIIHFSAFRRS